MVVVDAHSDYALHIYREYLKGNKNVLKEQHLPFLRKGGVKIEVLTVGGDFDLFPEFNSRDYNTIIKVINSVKNEISENHDLFYLIKNSRDFEKIGKNNKVGYMLALEGSGSIGSDFSLLYNYFDLGVRSIAMTHNNRNQFADGCAEKFARGLSDLGKEFIIELNKLNILLDLSHSSEPSFWDAINLIEKPPIASHSNVKHLCDHPRNLTDKQITAIAQKGGVIGMNFFSAFIDKNGKKANVDRLIDHIDHIIDLTGIEHVGLGPDFLNYYIDDFDTLFNNIPSDFDTASDPVKNFEVIEDVTGIPKFIESLQKRGYSDKEVGKIKGDNFIRVYKNVI